MNTETHIFEITETMTYRLSVDMPVGSTESEAASKATEIWDGLSATEIVSHSTGLTDQEFRKVLANEHG